MFCVATGVGDDTFVFDLRIVTEIDEQAKFPLCSSKVVHGLGAMFRSQSGDSFEFNNNMVVTEELRHINLFEYISFVEKL